MAYMWYISAPRRRECRRVPVEALCSLLHRDDERHAIVVDVSANGLRVQRPLGGPRTRSLQLEFEVPSADEIVWAKGEICFDEIVRVAPGEENGFSGVLRISGIRLVSAAERHKRLLRDVVVERARKLWRESTRLPGVTEPPSLALECDSLFDFS